MKRLILLVLVSVFILSCEDDSWKQELENIKTELANQKQLIEALQQSSTVTNIEQGDGQYTINFSDGQSITLSNGKTPIITIGDNGNWYIDGVDTGKPSQGHDGTNGDTPSIEIGENGNWIINGSNTGIKAEGLDGNDAPYIIKIVENKSSFIFYFSDDTTITCQKSTNHILFDYIKNKNLDKGEYIKLYENYIQKNIVMTAKISYDNIGDGIIIGRGYMSVTGTGIEITETTIKIHQYWQGKDYLEEVLEHNFNLKSPITIMIKVEDYDSYENHRKTNLTILNAEGNTYTYTINNNLFRGAPFIKSTSSPIMIDNLNINYFDLAHTVWTFGDSFYEFGWLQNLYKWGYYNFLADFYAGEGSTHAINCLKNNLNFSTPKYIVWGEGVNDASDISPETPNITWLKNTEELLQICEQKNITPIFLTFPSLHNGQRFLRDHRGKNNWIKKSGYRYSDVASCLEDGNGLWYEGLRGNGEDNIHPSAKGNYVYAIQILNDIPEFMY